MKRLLIPLLTLGLAVPALAAPPATADSEPANRAASDRAKISQQDAVTTGRTIRASQLIGMNIQNSQGDSVGEINDLVLDAANGRIRYAAVTYGGFLGVGNKMFAVPWEAFTARRDADDAHAYHLVLNVTQTQLEGAQGFDEEHWPNFADRKFTSDLDRRYGVQRREGELRTRDVEVDVNRRGVDVDVKPDRDN
jgi:sporulation protein YlmC with PRC-barrel domain